MADLVAACFILHSEFVKYWKGVFFLSGTLITSQPDDNPQQPQCSCFEGEKHIQSCLMRTIKLLYMVGVKIKFFFFFLKKSIVNSQTKCTVCYMRLAKSNIIQSINFMFWQHIYVGYLKWL